MCRSGPLFSCFPRAHRGQQIAWIRETPARRRKMKAVEPGRRYSERQAAKRGTGKYASIGLSVFSFTEDELSGNLPRRLRRNRLQPRPQPPDQPRPRHDSTEHRASSGIVAQELKKIAGHAVKEKIGCEHLSVELFPFEQPHQEKEIRQLNRRLEKLRGFERNAQRRAYPGLSNWTGESHTPEMIRRLAVAAACGETTYSSQRM